MRAARCSRSAASAGLAPFDRRTREGFLRNLVVREGRRTGQLQVRLVTSEGELDGDGLAAAVGCDGLLWTRTDARAETTAGGRTELLAGEPTSPSGSAPLSCASRPTRSSRPTPRWPSGSTRSSPRRPRSTAGSASTTSTAASARSASRSRARAGTVVGLEVVEDAVPDADRTPATTRSPTPTSTPATCGSRCASSSSATGRPDLLVVDPPRAGLSQKIVRRIIEAAPRRIVYVSCNPTTLAPNAAQLVEAGLRLERVTPVDMFPQTPHIECVAVLTR